MDCLDIYITIEQDCVSIPKDTFTRALRKLKNTQNETLPKPFLKTIYKRFYEDLIIEQTFLKSEYKTPTRESVYSLTETPYDDPLFNHVKRHNTIAINYKKKKYNLSQFPSTNQIYDCLFETKEIFKINNRTYLNFIESQYASDKSQKVYTIMINYVDCPNSDRSLHSQSIKTVLDYITELVNTV